MNIYIAIGLLLAVIGQTSGLERCDPGVCRLPTCYCGGREVRNILLSSHSKPQFSYYVDFYLQCHQPFFSSLLLQFLLRFVLYHDDWTNRSPIMYCNPQYRMILHQKGSFSSLILAMSTFCFSRHPCLQIELQ